MNPCDSIFRALSVVEPQEGKGVELLQLRRVEGTVVSQGLLEGDPIRRRTVDPFVAMSRDETPFWWQRLKQAAGVADAAPLSGRITAGQVDTTGSRREQQVSGMVDPVSMQGDVSGGVAWRVGDNEFYPP